MTTLFDFPYVFSNVFFDPTFDISSKQALVTKKDDNNYHLEIEVPGFSKENINLSVKEGKLYVTAEREGKSTKNFIYKLNSKINTSKIAASCKDGILNVILPIKETEQIKVKID